MRRRKGPRPAIRRSRNSRNNRNSTSNNSSNILPQDEGASNKLRREVARIINGTLAELEKRADEHDQRMKEARGKIDEVCNALREAVDGIEKHLIDTLQQGYTKEDERLHKMIQEMRELGSNILDNSNDNDNKGEYLNKEEEEDLNKAITEADGILRYVQEYSVKHPECEDVGKWARDALGAVLEMCVSQSLCRERLKGRTPRITSVTATGPNEVCIDFEFPRAEEEAALRGVYNFKKISYKAEMWNGEEGDCDVRSVQCIGPSRRVSVEWRLIGGSECKVRVRAVWRGPSGEECLSEWGEWATFTVPRKHKNSGAVRTSAAWANRAVGGETYTVVDTYSDEVIYAGSKPYAMLPQCPTGCDIVITGRRGEVAWEEVRNIENVPFIAKSFLEDLRLFHTDKEACLLALLGIAKSTECKSTTTTTTG